MALRPTWMSIMGTTKAHGVSSKAPVIEAFMTSPPAMTASTIQRALFLRARTMVDS